MNEKGRKLPSQASPSNDCFQYFPEVDIEMFQVRYGALSRRQVVVNISNVNGELDQLLQRQQTIVFVGVFDDLRLIVAIVYHMLGNANKPHPLFFRGSFPGLEAALDKGLDDLV
jgi:hypothetical protein